MTDQLLSLSSGFETATEADWLAGVEKALKGRGIERITGETRDGVSLRPLYRETDFPSATDPRGEPGQTPYLRGGQTAPDAHLPWDIRQRFTHPDPTVSNTEILRDLKRGVSSIEIAMECSGELGVIVCDRVAMETLLEGVRADIATVALDPVGAGTGTRVAAILAEWAMQQPDPEMQKLAFNIDVFAPLIRTGKVSGGLNAAFARVAKLTEVLALTFPLSTALRIDGRFVHEAGGTDAQELGALLAHAIATLKGLEASGLSIEAAASQMLFNVSLDGNYGLGIAKLRAARRLWARAQEALGLAPSPMRLQATTSRRMLTRFDPWVNMLRGTSACFAGAVGGADVITVRAFNAALGGPEELGRRVARNTQIIAMEESGLGKIADPSGGAWFTETVAEDLAQAAWSEFQTIEREGGFAASLMNGDLQARVIEAKTSLLKDIAHRRVPITGVSEFPLLEGIEAPVAKIPSIKPGDGVDGAALKVLLPDFVEEKGADALATPLLPMRLSEPFETLRDRADEHLAKTGTRPSIFAATLGPPAEHTARLDFARNLFAAGGIESKLAPVPPQSPSELAAAFKASGCQLAVICGTDGRYKAEAQAAASALKDAGAYLVWIAGKAKADGVDRNIYMGCDVAHEATLALAELGVA